MKGIVFTLEALITFSFFSVALLGAMILIQPSQPAVPLSETVLLNDFCQVLEMQYHDEVVEFMIIKEDSLPLKLAEYLLFLEETTGKRMFLEFDGKWSSKCEPLVQSERIFVYPSFSHFPDLNLVRIGYFHTLKVGICK